MNWQDAIALLVVAVCAGYVVRRAWSVLAGAKTGGCHCESTGCKGTQPDVVSIKAMVEPRAKSERQSPSLQEHDATRMR